MTSSSGEAIMFHKATVVPYGRLQFVDVDAGPIDRMFGLATVKLHTASASTDATIPGLPRQRPIACATASPAWARPTWQDCDHGRGRIERRTS